MSDWEMRARTQAERLGELSPGARLEARLHAWACAMQQDCGNLQSLILTGSLARGEGSWEGNRLMGDADVMLVFDPGGRLPTRQRLAGWEDAIAQALAGCGLQAAVGLSAVHPQYFRSLPPHIFACELKHSGRVLWGSDEALDGLPELTQWQLPREDAWRLLSNRMVELAPAACALRGRRCRSMAEAYPWVKLYLDMGTSFLVFTGEYEPNYAGRLQRLLADSQRWRYGAIGVAMPEAVIHRVAECTAWKLAPEGVPRGLARAGATAQAARDAEALWCWQLSQLTGAPAEAGWRTLWRQWLQQQGLGTRMRGWASAARRTRGFGCRLWPRWARLCLTATPRHLVYGTAAEMLFSCGNAGQRPLPLPLPYSAPGPAATVHPHAVLRNYRLLVESTRA